MEVRGADRAELEQWLRAQGTPQALATRARIVLGSAAGESVRSLAARLGVTQTTVCLWRRRYRRAGLVGLRTQPRAGRPRQISGAKEQAVSRPSLASSPTGTKTLNPSAGANLPTRSNAASAMLHLFTKRDTSRRPPSSSIYIRRSLAACRACGHPMEKHAVVADLASVEQLSDIYAGCLECILCSDEP